MPFYQNAKTLPQRFRLVLSSFMQHADLPFKDALSEERIQQAFDEEDALFAQDEDNVYTPAITLWAFLSQVLYKGEQRSCAAAVARVVVLYAALGREMVSDNTGAYCRARAKIPTVIIRRLALDVANTCERQIPGGWLWKGRHAYLVDGSTMSMEDTAANQKAYPQPSCQEEGLGFPLARVVVLISLATAMVKGMAMAPYAGKETGDAGLPFAAAGRFRSGEIIAAGARMGVDNAVRRRLAAEMEEKAREHRVLDHISKVPGVKGVTVVHGRRVGIHRPS